MPRGAKPNRTDLVAPTPPSGPGQANGQPVIAPTGMPYGEAGQLQQAQQQQPLPQVSPIAGGPPQAPQDPIQAAKNFQMPALGDLHGPTQKPNEPVTAGLPSGLGQGPSTQTDGIGALLSRMSSAVNSPALAQLAARATSLQQ